jgi:hypothetical protein
VPSNPSFQNFLIPPQKVVCLALDVEPLHHISDCVFAQAQAQRRVLPQAFDTASHPLRILRSHQEPDRIIQAVSVEIRMAESTVGNP